MQKIKEWFAAQGSYAKTAWGIVCVVVGMFGYEATLTQKVNNEESTTQIIDSLENVESTLLDEINKRLDIIQDSLNKTPDNPIEPTPPPPYVPNLPQRNDVPNLK